MIQYFCGFQIERVQEVSQRPSLLEKPFQICTPPSVSQQDHCEQAPIHHSCLMMILILHLQMCSVRFCTFGMLVLRYFMCWAPHSALIPALVFQLSPVPNLMSGRDDLLLWPTGVCCLSWVVLRQWWFLSRNNCDNVMTSTDCLLTDLYTLLMMLTVVNHHYSSATGIWIVNCVTMLVLTCMIFVFTSCTAGGCYLSMQGSGQVSSLQAK